MFSLYYGAQQVGLITYLKNLNEIAKEEIFIEIWQKNTTVYAPWCEIDGYTLLFTKAIPVSCG